MTNSDLSELLRQMAANDPLGPVDAARIAEHGEHSLRRRRVLAAGASAALVASTVASVLAATNGRVVSDPTQAPPVAGTSGTTTMPSGFKPSRAELRQAVRRHVTGGTLTEGYYESATGVILLNFDWSGAGITQNVGLTVYSGAAGQPPCLATRVVATCTQETIPDGRVVRYGEGKVRLRTISSDGKIVGGPGPDGETKPESYKTAQYRQPDGNWVTAAVITQPGEAGEGITKQQLIDLVTDPALDK